MMSHAARRALALLLLLAGVVGEAIILAAWLAPLPAQASAAASAPPFAIPASLARAAAHGTSLGIVMPTAMLAFDSVWATHPTVEVGLCATRTERLVRRYRVGEDVAADTIWRVWEVTPAETDSAGPAWIEARCAPGVPFVHLHLPSPYGVDDCQPSWQDREALAARGTPWDIVWCDRRSFVWYYPSARAP